MYKISIVILIIIIILIIGNMFISREGFYQADAEPEQTLSVFNPSCTMDDIDDSDCSVIDIENGSFRVNNVCPSDARCLGVCINDHTWTAVNKQQLGSRDSLYNVIGELKNPDQSHLVSSSRCMECVKNFYFIADIINNSKNCSPS